MDEGQQGLHISRRKLPHWRLEGSAYFVTWRLIERASRLTEEERTLIQECLLFGREERYKLYAYVVMDDHVHAVLRPLGSHELSRILHTWKSYTANQMQRESGRQGQVWDTETFDRIIREEAELIEKCEYVLTNPVRRWPDIVEYEWVGLG